MISLILAILNLINLKKPSIMLLILIIYIGLIVFLIASIWKMFEKAGQPGWAALVPFYNIYVLTQIAEKPGWWMLLFFVPLVNLVASIMVWSAISTRFGKGDGFTVGLVLLSFIFIPILGFGDAQYKGINPTGGNDDILDDVLEN